MSVKSSGSHDGPTQSTGDIIRSGTLKKLKTARKKYFVLRAETPDALARLEYYDSEKKFRSGVPPKRCIPLKTCFDINKRQDTKHKHVIALYTKDDCFCILLDSEEDLKFWLKDLLTLQHGEEIPEGETPKPKFEYVWQVHLCERGLGAGRTGLYRLCLTDKTVTLVKIDEPMPTVIELSLASVRSCGNLKNFFFLEVGRSSNLGAGEFWFEADDTNIASNLQATVSHRFKLIREKAKLAANTEANDIQPKGRTRSSSATESSKSNNKRFNSSSRGGYVLPQGFRDRSDSVPTRPRTSSEGNHVINAWTRQVNGITSRGANHRDVSHSPLTGSPISPPSDSTGSSYSLPDEHDGTHDLEHQRMYSTLTPDEVIAEEECPESPRANPQTGNYLPMNHFPDTPYVPHNFPSTSASMSSVTSGTPSTDMRFSDYPLDKVFSYVSADDDDARPCRAYSVGSKPPEAQLASTPENARVRAFSVGSKSKKYNRVLPPHHHPPSVKSSSAPLLAPNSRIGSSHGSINNPMDDLMEMDFSTGTTRSRTSTNASGSSDVRTACNHRNASCNNGSRTGFLGFLDHLGLGGDHNKKTPEGYVEMKPGHPRTTSGSSDVSPYVDMTQGQRASAYVDMSGNGNNVPFVGHAYSPYLDMSGNNGANSGSNTPQVGNDDSPYMDMSGGNNNGRENYMDMAPGSSPVRSSPKPSTTLSEYVRQFGRTSTQDNNRSNDYMDMYQSRRRANSNSSMPRVATSPGAWTTDHNSDYLDMTGKNNSRRTERTNSFGSQMSSSPHLDTTSPKYNSDYLSFGVQERIPEATAHDIEGYVQMTPGDFTNIGNVKHQRQSSIDSMDNEHGDYLNMSGINLGASTSKTKPSKKERSQPISIQTTSNNQGVKNSSPISISSLLGRRLSPTGSSPKMHLPLSPYSSLPRQKSPRKSSHAGSSKDSSSVSSSVTTTPSSSSTMFPLSLNSPSSPAAGPSKAGTPTTAMKVPVSILNVPYKSGGARRKTNNEDDYAMMDFEPMKETSRVVDESPYMNYCPPGASALKTPVALISKDDNSGDYVIMKPGTLPTKPTTLPRAKSGSSSGLASPLANHFSTVGLNDRHTMCFRPIREKDERMPSPKPGDQVPDRLTHDDKTLETANMEGENEAPYDLLRSFSGPVSPAAKMSRPSSSNSDKIKSGTQRPASTTGTEKSSRPSSVCSEGLHSRLGSSSSVYSSSSSTSTVVSASTKPDQPESEQQNQPHHVIKLHYASLDLSSDSEVRKSPRPSTSNDVGLAQGGATFVYADIDFIRSEELSRNSGQSVSSSSNTAIKN